jgi:hypothetical protein
VTLWLLEPPSVQGRGLVATVVRAGMQTRAQRGFKEDVGPDGATVGPPHVLLMPLLPPGWIVSDEQLGELSPVLTGGHLN